MKTKILTISMSLLLMMTGALFCGCKDERVIKAYNATATVTLDDLPDSFNEMNKYLKDKVHVYVSLGKKDSSHYFSREAELNASNNFKSKLYLEPGQYTLLVKVYPTAVEPFYMPKEKQDNMVIDISSNSNTDLRLKMEEHPAYEALNSIKKLSPFSRKIQIKNKVYDISELKDHFSFNWDNSVSVECFNEKKYSRYFSAELPNLYILTEEHDPDHTIVGIKCTNQDYIFGYGIKTGASIEDVANKDHGCMGKPVYCYGSPLHFFFIDDASYIYIDPDSEDQIRFNVHTGTPYIDEIELLFGKES